MLRAARHFGITDTAEFDPSLRPAHEPCLTLEEIGGRGRLSIEKEALPLDLARALRASLVHAIEQLDAAIEDAGVEDAADGAA